ncbi:MAG: hypothetical protein OXC37_03425, partial [Bdellovibrionaceae bacterium]|nr:hypothetical protein [Pseudobdellovibrionaceae bacterium]
IKLALKNMIDQYPSLIKRSNNKINYNIHFLDRSKGNNKKVLQLSGGKSDGEGIGKLLNLINIYKKRFKKYHGWETPKNPVILLTDNDEGVKTLFTQIKNQFEKDIKIDSDDDFFPIFKNLYLIKTPHIDQKTETCIEDLFNQEQLKSFNYNGKFFPKEKKGLFNNSEHYGKKILATKMLPQKFSDVDFTGFKPLLDRLQKVIVDYKSKNSQPSRSVLIQNSIKQK